MTQQEVREKSKAKTQQIYDLAKLLNMTFETKQAVNRSNGFIELVIVMTDHEKYDIDKPQFEPSLDTTVPGEVLPPVEAPKAEVTADETPKTDA